MEVLHVLPEHLSELAQHLLVPGVILQVDLGLDFAVVDDDWTELLPGLGIIEGSSGFPDLDQERLPLVEVLSQAVVDVLGLHVPQTLVLQPHLEWEEQMTRIRLCRRVARLAG